MQRQVAAHVGEDQEKERRHGQGQVAADDQAGQRQARPQVRHDVVTEKPRRRGHRRRPGHERQLDEECPHRREERPGEERRGGEQVRGTENEKQHRQHPVRRRQRLPPPLQHARGLGRRALTPRRTPRRARLEGEPEQRQRDQHIEGERAEHEGPDARSGTGGLNARRAADPRQKDHQRRDRHHLRAQEDRDQAVPLPQVARRVHAEQHQQRVPGDRDRDERRLAEEVAERAHDRRQHV